MNYCLDGEYVKSVIARAIKISALRPTKARPDINNEESKVVGVGKSDCSKGKFIIP